MINLISKDLRKEEVYIQIADCLEHLERITNDSFEKINCKLKSMNEDLVEIERRRKLVKNKIEQIKKNNNKAVQIFSSFHYPAKEIRNHYNYESLIQINSSRKRQFKNQFESSIINQSPKYEIQQPLELFHPDDLNDHLNFLDLETFLQTERENLNFLQRKKLNKSTIPWNRIKSISSLIIFNSFETPYMNRSDQESSVYDSRTANRHKKAEEEDELNFVVAPPKSMTNKKERSQFDNLFRLDSQEAPEILEILPNDLPELNAVADDIFFSNTIINNPSSSIRDDETRYVDKKENKQNPSQMFRIFSFDQSSTSSIEEIKPIKPQTVEHRSNELSTSEIHIKSEIGSVITPPPPPPLLISFNEIENQANIERKQQLSTVADDSRANLLDAIRRAGGKPDKSKVTIKEKKLEERKNRKEAVSTDLISDLKKHLMSRRQAMSGIKKDETVRRPSRRESAGNVYSSMNKMIPSPTVSSGDSSDDNDSSDDDWVNN